MKIILSISLLAEIIFLNTYAFAPFVKKRNKELAAKTVCAVTYVIIGFLSAMASGGYNTLYDVLITIGAIFGAIGDYTLKMDMKSKGFLVGITSFLIGHIFYISAFISSFIKLNGVHFIHFMLIIAASLLILILFVIAGVKLHVDTGKSTVPILFYCMTITVMLVSAAALSFSIADKWGACCILLGAILFVVSDTVLVLNNFTKRRNKINSAVNPLTYFPAQVLIALSINFIN